VVLSFLFFAGWGAKGSDVSRYQVERGSELEKELGYKLSVQDHHDEERSLGLDAAVPIEGAASDYLVKFRATVAGRLKDLFELDLTLTDANGRLIRVPLAIRPIWSKENEVDVADGLVRQIALVRVARERFRKVPGYFRAVLTLRVRATALDLFYNSVSGYRAQYYQAADLGTVANRFALDRLVLQVLRSVTSVNKPTCPPAWVEKSLRDRMRSSGLIKESGCVMHEGPIRT